MQWKQKAKIDNWSAIPRPGGEDPNILILVGDISEHPDQEANGAGTTSPLIWFSQSFRIAETANTIYELGKPNEEWVALLAERGLTPQSLEPTLP
jgi:hypothetical protein